MRARRWARAVGYDLSNAVRYGRHAPLRCQRIWVVPAEVETAVDGLRRALSGRVISGDWDRETFPVEDVEKIRFSRLRWDQGFSWDETGAYDFSMRMIAQHGGRFDGCETLEDVVRRYERLDEVFDQVRREGRLRTAAELGGSFRESGGVYVHIGRDCQPVFSLRGNHRLAIARILSLSLMPAQLGVVHPEALPSWRRTYSPQGPDPAVLRPPH